MSAVPSPLHAILRHPGVWRANRPAHLEPPGLPTGLGALDAQLPGGGWPMGAVTELCYARDGIGELSLLTPALARLTAAQRWVMFVGAPYPLYAPALAAAGLDLRRVAIIEPPRAGQIAWAAEQALHSGVCGAVVAWLAHIDDRGLRRLQLAAEAGRCLCALLRPLTAATQASPAALRLRLDRHRRLHIGKCRGRVERTAPPTIDLGARTHAMAGT
jgi:hypothetical protein